MLLQMLAQHGIHISAYRDFPSGDVVHDFENLVVDIAADIDALAGLYLVSAEEHAGIVVLLPFAASAVFGQFLFCRCRYGMGHKTKRIEWGRAWFG